MLMQRVGGQARLPRNRDREVARSAFNSRAPDTPCSISTKNRSRRVLFFLASNSAWTKPDCIMVDAVIAVVSTKAWIQAE